MNEHELTTNKCRHRSRQMNVRSPTEDDGVADFAHDALLSDFCEAPCPPPPCTCSPSPKQSAPAKRVLSLVVT